MDRVTKVLLSLSSEVILKYIVVLHVPARTAGKALYPELISIFFLLFFSIVLLLSRKQALEELKQTVQHLKCTETKLSAQKELLDQKVQENEGKEPPPVVNYEEDARSVTSMVSGFIQFRPITTVKIEGQQNTRGF